MREHDSKKKLAVGLRDDGMIILMFGEDHYEVSDPAAMKFAKAIARILRHKESQAREAT